MDFITREQPIAVCDHPRQRTKSGAELLCPNCNLFMDKVTDVDMADPGQVVVHVYVRMTWFFTTRKWDEPMAISVWMERSEEGWTLAPVIGRGPGRSTFDTGRDRIRA